MIKLLLQVLSDVTTFKNLKGEDKLANDVACELKALSIEGRINCLWFHVPNETVVQTKTDIARLKKKHAIGMISGAPDFVFLAPNTSVCIELKTETGKSSPNQKLFAEWAENSGVAYYIARSINDVKKYLKLENLLQ